MANNRQRKTKLKVTFGGLPLFFFGASADAPAEATAAPDEEVGGPCFLFLLPLGRPRPRFVGD
jgi:hypothetical protein